MHPYTDLPEHHFWKSAISNKAWRDVQFLTETKFKINPRDKIATAGSCFAQHISNFLRKNGTDIYIAEPAHPILSDELAQQMHYGQFSARYGNIYTVRQLLELFLQAFEKREIIGDYAFGGDSVYDLLRPAIQPNGFVSVVEAQADRAFHIRSVRKMFETTDVFVYTLGLTEAWVNAEQNFVYPSCPGTVQGEFNKDKHKPVNFTCSQIINDLISFIDGLLEVNPKVKIILTVSPVALAATFENENVLVATSYSKSVLRAVCGEVRNLYPNVEYFPSYEIITSSCSFGQYLASDLREVSPRGVSHVMSCFSSLFYSENSIEKAEQIQDAQKLSNEYSKVSQSIVEAECEEMLNDPSVSS